MDVYYRSNGRTDGNQNRDDTGEMSKEVKLKSRGSAFDMRI